MLIDFILILIDTVAEIIQEITKTKVRYKFKWSSNLKSHLNSVVLLIHQIILILFKTNFNLSCMISLYYYLVYILIGLEAVLKV